MTPTEDLKHDVTILIECIETLTQDVSHEKEMIVMQAYYNLRHKHSRKEALDV